MFVDHSAGLGLCQHTPWPEVASAPREDPFLLVPPEVLGHSSEISAFFEEVPLPGWQLGGREDLGAGRT